MKVNYILSIAFLTSNCNFLLNYSLLNFHPLIQSYQGMEYFFFVSLRFYIIYKIHMYKYDMYVCM